MTSTVHGESEYMSSTMHVPKSAEFWCSGNFYIFVIRLKMVKTGSDRGNLVVFDRDKAP